MPLATMPWWKSLAIMNENKGVFGLNMLHWWDREGNLHRVIEPLLDGPRQGRTRARGRRGVSVRPRRRKRTASSRSGATSERSSWFLSADGRWLRRARPLVASIGSLYDRAIVDTGRQPEFLFFVAFLVTFGFIRTSAHLIRAQVSWWPGQRRGWRDPHPPPRLGDPDALGDRLRGVSIAPPSPWPRSSPCCSGSERGWPWTSSLSGSTSRTFTGQEQGRSRSTR